MIISEQKLLGILSKFKSSKISVLGDVGLDKYTKGSVDRISPEAPVPVVLVKEEIFKLGLAANVAENIVALGGNSSLIGIIGSDEGAVDLTSLLKNKGIPTTNLVIDPSRRTILKERIVAESQQMLRVDYESPGMISEKPQKNILGSIAKSIRYAHALIIEDYAKGLLTKETIKFSIAKAKEKGIPVLVDPNLKTPAEWYSGATLLTPNKKEAEFLSGIKIEGMDSLIKAGKSIITKTKSKSLVITLSADGMAIFKSLDSKPIIIPTFAKEVFDVSGAGDTVIAVLGLVLSCGEDLELAAYIANLAAGIEVSKRGTATVSQAEIIQAYIRQGN